MVLVGGWSGSGHGFQFRPGNAPAFGPLFSAAGHCGRLNGEFGGLFELLGEAEVRGSPEIGYLRGAALVHQAFEPVSQAEADADTLLDTDPSKIEQVHAENPESQRG